MPDVMSVARRQLLVARISAGVVPLRLPQRGRTERFTVRPLDRTTSLLAHEVYADALADALAAGLYTETDLLAHLYEHGLWDDEKQKLLVKLPDEIEQFKVKLFQAGFRSNERKVVRAALATARAKLAEVTARRHAADHLSAEGTAEAARVKFVVGRGLHTAAGVPVFPTDDAFFDGQSPLLDAAISALTAARVGEGEYRELCRTEPWRSLWSASKAERGVFGVAAADLTDEQAAMVGWAQLYDSVRSHPQCPSDEVLADDDLLDGWLIVQRRQREDSARGMAADGAAGSARDKQEVFLVAETADDARKVIGLNDELALATQRQRFAALRRHGELSEADMPDTKQSIRLKQVQQMTAALAAPAGK